MANPAKTYYLEKFNIPLNEIAEEFQSQLDTLLDDATKIAIGDALAHKIDPWVPFLEGHLSQELNITPEYIEYTVPYATRQYYGDDFKHTIDYHPLATAHWDEVAMQTQLEPFLAEVNEILERRSKQINGG